jgi:transposase
MQVLHPRCCGLDVHKKLIVACVLLTAEDGTCTKHVRSFGAATKQLWGLCDWLASLQVRIVAMESTGVYWKPVWNILEGELELMLINAQHYKTVPGRKSDVADAEWIAELLRHGLLKASFVPPAFVRDLRELTRHRRTLVEEAAREKNRLQKVLESANIKLGSVVSDVLGASGRRILRAIISGPKQAQELARLGDVRLCASVEQLEEALSGRVREHHRFLLKEHLDHIEYLERSIERLGEEVASRLASFRWMIEALDSIPGINRRGAEDLLAETGTDMSRFGSGARLSSWAGMCPGSHQSGGKRLSGKTRKGSPWLRRILVTAAKGAAKKKGSFLKAQYERIKSRRGANKAAVAVGHTILEIAYVLLTRGEQYQDLGTSYYDERDRERLQRRLVRRLEQLGLEVSITPKPKAA